ncbi:hypothetical protein B0T09DRAFT_344855, partial [Sordaria sp. MPI-SDFR-AT-0083]
MQWHASVGLSVQFLERADEIPKKMDLDFVEPNCAAWRLAHMCRLPLGNQRTTQVFEVGLFERSIIFFLLFSSFVFHFFRRTRDGDDGFEHLGVPGKIYV